jgi:hypothetical protein
VQDKAREVQRLVFEGKNGGNPLFCFSFFFLVPLDGSSTSTNFPSTHFTTQRPPSTPSSPFQIFISPVPPQLDMDHNAQHGEKGAPPVYHQPQQGYSQQQQPMGMAPMSAGGGTAAPANLVGTGEGREWSTGLCACKGDYGGFCFAFWCPCFVRRLPVFLVSFPSTTS